MYRQTGNIQHQIIAALLCDCIIAAMVKMFDRQNDKPMTRQQVREVDSWAINTLGVPGVVLMENAGRGCCEVIVEQLKKLGSSRVCIFCGTGNNGGDGFVIARLLKNAGYIVRVILCGSASKIKGDAQINYKTATNIGIEILELSSAEQIQTLAGDYDLLVDAIFGTGLTGELKPQAAAIINAMNKLNKPVIAVDIPSGLDCDTGEPLGASIRAIATVTFVAAKTGFLNPRSSEYTGTVYIASIGVEPN
jgi:NAD(P)H-hydrate epimerase